MVPSATLRTGLVDVAELGAFLDRHQPATEVVAAGGVFGGEVQLEVPVDIDSRISALRLFDAVAVSVIDEISYLRAVLGY